MSDFFSLVAAVHGEVWEGGTEASPHLSALLMDLAAAETPEGVIRLSTARMAPGPHLAAQDAAGGDQTSHAAGLADRRDAATRRRVAARS